MSVLASSRILQCFRCLVAETHGSSRIFFRGWEGACAHAPVLTAVLALSQHDDETGLAAIAVFKLVKGVRLLLRWHCEGGASRENGLSGGMRFQ